MTDHSVRAAKATDETAILALAQAEMAAHESIDPRFKLRPDANARYAVYLRDRLRDIDSAVFVAEAGDRIVGSVIASVRTQESFFEARRFGYVSDLIVAPDLRRSGVGRAMWQRSAMWFRGLGIRVVRVHVAVRSDEAREFWRRVGAEDFLCEAWIDLPAAELDRGVPERREQPEGIEG
ncbi:MAG: GNAT family N-acetyltransferase [bacterium]